MIQNKNKKIQVSAIKFGTVIDHIPTKIGFNLLTLCKLIAIDQPMTISLNVPSNTLGRKDLIKIENTLLTKQQTDQIAMYTPNATVNCIDNYAVVRKLTLNLSNHINGILTCPNRNCISRQEPISSSFSVEFYNSNKTMKCRYCEKEFKHQIVFTGVLQ